MSAETAGMAGETEAGSDDRALPFQVDALDVRGRGRLVELLAGRQAEAHHVELLLAVAVVPAEEGIGSAPPAGRLEVDVEPGQLDRPLAGDDLVPPVGRAVQGLLVRLVDELVWFRRSGSSVRGSPSPWR